MGGIGSGRRCQFGKNTTTNCYSLDVRKLQRDKLLVRGSSYGLSWHRNDEKVASINISVQSDHITLDYRQRNGDRDWQNKNYAVMLSWTDCRYGGRRAWFLCPASECGRRVAILYIAGSGIFACRHCYQLAYDSQRETYDDRAARRADKIRDRLGWQRGILNRNGSKPKGMHEKTYRQLRAKHDALVDTALVGIARRLDILKNFLGE